MKYAIIIPDGCADEPQEVLGNQTPLQAATVPAMDEIAAAGCVGRARNVPDHLPAGSAVASMSLLGYDPATCFTGRAPLEAAAQGIALGADDWAIRCNLVTILDQMMRDFTAGHISTAEATELLRDAQQKLGDGPWQFYPGVSYRNLLIYRGGPATSPFSLETRTTPPHDLTDQTVLDDFPRGPGSDLLNEIMSRSVEWFTHHSVNVRRVRENRLPATNVWLWGIGKKPSLQPFYEQYGIHGMMITAVDLLRGIAALIGWPRIDVPGATGYKDTDYRAKGRYAVEALAQTDLVCVHVEATDEASHEGDVEGKVAALQQIDEHIVRPLWDALRAAGDFRILVSPDHPTPLRTKTHSHGFVPLAMAGSRIQQDSATTYDERSAESSTLAFDEGWRMMNTFVR